MRKIKIIVISLVVIIFSCCIFLFSACSNNTIVIKEEYHEEQALSEINLEKENLDLEWIDSTYKLVSGENIVDAVSKKDGKEKNIKVKIIATPHHSEDEEYIILKEPSCEEDGIKCKQCDICGKYFDYESINKLGHKFDIKEYVQGDCQHYGYTMTKCSRCGEYKRDENGEIIKDYDDFYGNHHLEKDEDGNYIVKDENIIIPPTCQCEGKGKTECTICHQLIEVDMNKTAHIFENKTHYDADCQHYGYTTFKCSVCGADKVDENGDIYRECDTVKGNHHYVNSVCTICGHIDTDSAIKTYDIGEEKDKVFAYLFYAETINSIPLYNMVISGTGRIGNVDFLWQKDTLNVGLKTYKYIELIRSLIICDGVTDLSSSLMANAVRLENLQLNNQITSIPSYCFYNCSSLENLVLPNNIITISSEAFRNCIKLKNVQFSEKLDYIANYAFLGCNNINIIDLSMCKDLRIIGDYALYNKNSIIFLPDSNISTSNKSFSSDSIIICEGNYKETVKFCYDTTIYFLGGIKIKDIIIDDKKYTIENAGVITKICSADDDSLMEPKSKREYVEGDIIIYIE